jgi:hypothetical protein
MRDSSTNFRARLIALDRCHQHSELGRLPATAVRLWEFDYRDQFGPWTAMVPSGEALGDAAPGRRHRRDFPSGRNRENMLR